MDEEQKRIVLMASIVAFLIFSTLIICTKQRKTSTDRSKTATFDDFAQEEDFIKSQMAKKSAKDTEKAHTTGSQPSYQAPARILTPVKFSDRRIAENKKFAEEAEKRRKAYLTKRTQEILKDPNTSSAKLLRARLITSNDYVTAFTAFKDKDYKTAIKSYHEVFKDKNSTIEMKYIALEGLQESAKKTGDLDLFLISSQELGKLIMANDFPLFSKTKSPDYYEWAIKLTTFLKARKDNSIKEKLISDLMENNHVTRKEAERITMVQIQEYEILFKELVN